jgi:hypothetical protein
MPTILFKNGFRFYIPTLDHPPAHVHVAKAGKEAKFLLEPVVEIDVVMGMSMKDLTTAYEMAVEHHDEFMAAWKRIHPDQQ